MSHTPEPWQAEIDDDGIFHITAVEDGEKVFVARVNGDTEYAQKFSANAHLIVRAVNNHANLLAACKAVLSSPRYGDTPSAEAVEMVRATIAQVERQVSP